MRRASTAKPAAGPAALKKPAAAATTVKRAAPPTVDDQMDYIMNLKGQVYLLAIENEMMKKTITEVGPTRSASGVSATSASRGPTSGPSLAASQQQFPAMSSADLQAGEAAYPGEISDAFEMMRQKYGQLEGKYQQDLEQARRGAEALSMECAAQSSMITTLKKESATASENLRAQKLVMQELEQRSASDLERALRDIASLQDRIEELGEVLGAKDDELAQKHTTMADLRSVAANTTAEKNAGEAARQRTLESYGRVYMVSRYLLQRWRFERKDKLGIMESFERMRADKMRALEERDAAVTGREVDRIAAVEASAGRERALQAHRETKVQVNLVEQEVLRLTAELELKTRLVSDLDVQVPDLQRKADVAQATAAKAVGHKESAIKRANELERLLADKAAEADTLRAAAVRAEARMRDAVAKVKGLEDELAATHARVKTLDGSELQLDAEVARLMAMVESEGQRAATAQAEILQLRDELAKRPPIDIIKQLDIENLMQRNVQAAAAMHQLLAWRDANDGGGGGH